MKSSPTHGFVGAVTLLFAACPSIELGVMMIPEIMGASGDHLPVGVGVPPIWMFFLASLALSVPWIVAGVLLLKRISAGQWLALALTVPSALLVLFLVGGVIDGLHFWWHDSVRRSEHTEGLIPALVFSPFILLGLLFCVTVWRFQFSDWRGLKQNPSVTQKSM